MPQTSLEELIVLRLQQSDAAADHDDQEDDRDYDENSEMLSEHLQQLGSRLELGFPAARFTAADDTDSVQTTPEQGDPGRGHMPRPSWSALTEQSQLHAQLLAANENARSTYMQKLPVSGTVRQSQRGSVAGDTVAQLDTVDDGISVGTAAPLRAAFHSLRESSALRSPVLHPSASPEGATKNASTRAPPTVPALSKNLNSWIRLLLPSTTLATRARGDSDTVNAVRQVTAALNLRSKFQWKYHVYDSPVVLPRPTDSDYWGSTEPIYRPQDCPILPNLNGYVKMVDGIVNVFTDLQACPPSPSSPANSQGPQDNFPVLESPKPPPSVDDYLTALHELMHFVQSPAVKTLCYQRLRYLEERFSLHLLFNGNQEIADVRSNNHRDFYNVRKVDTHVHHSACMTQKHLLRFIRRKYRKEGDTVVAKNAAGEDITLAEIFHNDLGLTAWETSVDHLNVHALNSCFHRFDLFNTKYNPFGAALLRDVFLKTDNLIGGRYLAEMTREVMDDLEAEKYQHVEWRISIYGHSRSEWSKLANWIKEHKLYSKNVRWVIQVPRLYHVYRSRGCVTSMEHLLCNVFEPVIEAILKPQDHPEIFAMLHSAVAWDSVDDESVQSKFTTATGGMPLPQEWTHADNPPYTYWAYYMYANIRMVNTLLQARGMNAMAFRPHCGEAGNLSHLATAGLLADGINHGIMLRKTPVLQYLYYLWQIPLAMSPLSNNALFHEITKSPVNSFFKIGLNVSLSSDDPLMFHFTDQALLEEYSVCAHVWKFTPVDLCELARNSVLQSSFEPQFKRHWIGPKYYKKGPKGNRIESTNVPDIRLAYREETLKEELKFLRDVLMSWDTERDSPVLLMSPHVPVRQSPDVGGMSTEC